MPIWIDIPKVAIEDVKLRMTFHRSSSESETNRLVFYRGLTFRGEVPYTQNGQTIDYLYIFSHGFRQSEQEGRTLVTYSAEPTSEFTEALTGAHRPGNRTDRYGISTTTSYETAKIYCNNKSNACIYILDLFDHPFAVNVLGSFKRFNLTPWRAVGIGPIINMEVNVGNSIDKALIVGCINPERSQYIANQNYSGSAQAIVLFTKTVLMRYHQQSLRGV